VHPGGLRAIGCMIAAVAAFALMDALLKLLAAHYPPMEVAMLRGAASLPFMLLPLALSGRWHELRPRRWYMHLLRGALSVVILGGFIYAVRVLSLANAYAVFLSAPLIVTALSVPLLKERADVRNWRWLVALGVLATVAQYLLTEAFRSAPLFIVAPFEYTSLLWGIAIDRLVWHVLPSMRVVLGGGLVIASGLYLIWHERPVRGGRTSRQSWKWTARQGRMLRRSSTIEGDARKQEEDSP
jgi:drug/metabolite transporter (DMT)-like permease